MNVLVLGVGGNVSQGIVKALREITDIDIRIIGACISRSSVGLYMCDEAYISPYANDPEFVNWYIDFCALHEIDICFTGVEENIDALLAHREEIEKKCSTRFIYPSGLTWSVGQDKYETCRFLKENGCNAPAFAKASDRSAVKVLEQESGYPLIAKPCRGKSSSGIQIFGNPGQLEGFLASENPKVLENYVIEECIGDADSEYTVGCYANQNGQLLGMVIMHRILKSGTTSICEIVENDIIEAECRRICAVAKPVGPFNIQLRIDEGGRPVCFEWNVRYSGTTAIRNHYGFRDVEAGIREYAMKQSPSEELFRYRKGCAVRYDEEMYFEHLPDIKE